MDAALYLRALADRVCEYSRPSKCILTPDVEQARVPIIIMTIPHLSDSKVTLTEHSSKLMPLVHLLGWG